MQTLDVNPGELIRKMTPQELYDMKIKEIEGDYEEELSNLNNALNAALNDEAKKNCENLINLAIKYHMIRFSLLPYYKLYFEWYCNTFSEISDNDYSNLLNTVNVPYTKFENIAVSTYLHGDYSQKNDDLYNELYNNYKSTQEETQPTLDNEQTETFLKFLNLCFKPAMFELISDINSGKYRKKSLIYNDLTAATANKDDRTGPAVFIQELNKPKDDLYTLIIKYAKQNNFTLLTGEAHLNGEIKDDVVLTGELQLDPKAPSERLATFVDDYGNYSRVFSNQLALSMMYMYTSDEISDDKKNLLSNAEKRYKPQRRDNSQGVVNEIIINALESNDFMINWGTAEKRLFALYNEFICKSGSNRNIPFTMSLEDFIKKCDLSISNKKETRKVIKNALIAMGSTSIVTKVGVVNLFQSATISNGIINIFGADAFANSLAERNQSMFLPPEYFTCKGKNAISSMNVIQTLCFNYGNYNNVNASELHSNHRNEKITVKSLLSHTDIITIEEVRKQGTTWKQKIKSPLENILNYFPGIDCWSYIDGKGSQMLPERLPDSISYEEWEHLVIQYNIETFPIDTVKEAIATKRGKADESRRILSDKAAIARDRSEQRKERKNKGKVRKDKNR